ncbi:MAG: ABC transporter permease [Syntrophobacterales bacterium]|nr:ABC transporter permease [Syntrophobacterales bacterium]
MRGFWAVYAKELYSFWASPILYVVLFVFFLLSGYFFYSAVAYYNLLSFQATQNPFVAQELNAVSIVVRPFLLDISIVLLLLSPLLTMRLFAEEKKTGTIELLLTYPITEVGLVCAKLCAVVTVLLILLAGTLPYMVLLGYLTKLSVGVVISGYLGVILMGTAFLALGLFTSTVTQNQIIAATLSFGALLGFWIISWMKSITPSTIGKVCEYLSLTYHFDPFSKGLIDTRHITYYFVFILFFLFLTIRRIDVERWRG